MGAAAASWGVQNKTPKQQGGEVERRLPGQDASLLQPITPPAQHLPSFVQFKSWGRNVDWVTKDTTSDIPPRFSRVSSVWLRGRVPTSNLMLATVHSSACRIAEDKWCNRDLQIQLPVQEIFKEGCCCFHFPKAKQHRDKLVRRGRGSFKEHTTY